MNKGIFLLLGTNQGDRLQNLLLAAKQIETLVGQIIKRSSIYETEAWGKTDQAAFFNQVIEINSTLDPQQLLTLLLEIEIKLGRERKEKWGPRTIDLDILFYNNEIVFSPNLQIPHPGIPERRFTLKPLCEIAPEFLHPVIKKSCLQLLEDCKDKLDVKLFL